MGSYALTICLNIILDVKITYHLLKILNTEGAWQYFVYQLTNYISKLVDIWAFSGTIEYAHGAPLVRLKMSNIISLLVLAWNQKGKYFRRRNGFMGSSYIRCTRFNNLTMHLIYIVHQFVSVLSTSQFA